MDQSFTDQLHAHARSVGVDLLGIAPIERFADVPLDKHPAAIFPEVASVIVVGKRITRGVLRGVEEGTQFDLYGMFGQTWLVNRVLAMATFRTSEFLENHGWEAVPLPNLPPQTPALGVAVRPGQPAPNVMLDFDDAAVRAGVGEIGLCGMVLTPEFGPRQRFQMILTDAILAPSPLLDTPVCTRCAEEATVCPLGAIDVTQVAIRDIAGKATPVAAVDDAICRRCKNGAQPNGLHVAGTADRFAALCTRNCLVHLEESGRLSTSFQHPFRTREPWGVIEETRRL
jgi:epoxyqueuosine reductase QueG